MADYGNILGQSAYVSPPELINQRRAGLMGLIDMVSRGKDDPSKKQLAQHAPSTLNDPDPISIIGGAFGKLSGAKPMSTTPMTPGMTGLTDVDTSNVGNFGDVNTTAHNDDMGAPADSKKPGFWDSKGGNILGSILGVIALGGLGAGIGAISGGRRGAGLGASYGMGFGTLQDLALRKQSMEAPTNLMKLENEKAKIEESSKSEFEKTMEYMNSQKGGAGTQDAASAYKAYYDLKNPYAAEDRIYKQQQADISNQFRMESSARLKAEQDRLKQQNLDKKTSDLSDDLRTTQAALRSFDNINNQLGGDIESYDPKRNAFITKDPNTGQEIIQEADIPGRSIPGYGRFWSGTGEGRRLGADVQQMTSLQIYDRTGKAINIPELENFKFELGAGKLNSEADFLASYQKANRAIKAKLKDIKAGYNPEVVSEYEGRGGTTSPTSSSPSAADAASSSLQQRAAQRLRALGVAGY